MPPRIDLDATTVGHFQHCIDNLASDSKPNWGSLSAPAMVSHVTQGLRYACGQGSPADQSTFFMRRIMFPVAFYTPLPWPKGKGKIKVPAEFFPAPEQPFEDLRNGLLTLTDQFVEDLFQTSPSERIHPAFGSLRLQQWSRVSGMHLAHHLTQFGVWEPL